LFTGSFESESFEKQNFTSKIPPLGNRCESAMGTFDKSRRSFICASAGKRLRLEIWSCFAIVAARFVREQAFIKLLLKLSCTSLPITLEKHKYRAGGGGAAVKRTKKKCFLFLLMCVAVEPRRAHNVSLRLFCVDTMKRIS